MEELKKKPKGRPSTGKARTAAQRKRDQRASDMTAIAETPDDLWNERQCLSVLSSSMQKDSPLQKAAWTQLGRLRGFA